MSKETYIGGDLIEEIGGSYKIFAQEGYGVSSNKEVIFNGEDGILYGTNGEAPAFNNTIVDFYVDVFRSKVQIPDNYGLKDSDFKGTFGFDRYNEATSGKGKQSLSGFEEMGFNGNKYYVPWLCLWPPKKDLGKISDVDKNYIPVTIAKLVFKICEGRVKSGTAKFTISSNHPNIKIDGAEKIEKQGVINSSLEITISCDGVLEKDVDVEVKNETGIVIGKLKVVKNSTIYIANTKFITVIEEEKATNKASKQQKRDAEKTQFQSLIQQVIVYLNKNSLNQSLIYVKGSVEDVFVIEKGKINRKGSTSEYSISITSPYFEGKSEDENIDDSKETNEEKELDKAIKELYNTLEKNYRKNKKNTYFCEDTVNQTDSRLFKNYKEKYQTYLNSLGGNKKVGGHIKDDKTLYVFVDKQQMVFSEGNMELYGYTFGADNSAFIFNKHVNERKFGTFAHEIAHSLGLEHTFELNEKEYRPNQTIDKEITEKEKTLKEKNIDNQNHTIDNTTQSIQDKFISYVASEKDLHKLTFNKAYFIGKLGGKQNYYIQINTRMHFVKNSALLEMKSKSTSHNDVNKQEINILEKANNEILELKKKKRLNKAYYIDVNISETQENFMDYDYGSNNIINPNFDHRSFWKWQWDSLKNSKFLIKKELK